jgi:hypothetical protein
MTEDAKLADELELIPVVPACYGIPNKTPYRAVSGDLANRIIERLRTQPNATSAREDALTGAAQSVLAERARQVAAEGWTPEHDDAHGDTQMAGAAACYALASVAHWAAGPAIQQFWPWDEAWWKPSDARRNLVKAGALILAEIERLDRATLIDNPTGGESHEG